MYGDDYSATRVPAGETDYLAKELLDRLVGGDR